MCYVKKGIPNPVSSEHRTGFDKTFLKVPCGCCPSCRQVKSNDWQVRSYYEFLDNHRQAFFVTLDFDDRHLPRWNGVPCFDSEKMKHFLGRLRGHIGKFRYFYSTDNQGLLKRPHYHIIVLPSDFTDKAVFFRAVQKCWYYGQHEDVELLPSVNGDKMKALKYVSGYVNKDISYNLDKEFSNAPMRYRHRVQASKGFGAAPLLDGRISVDMILRGEKIALPIGKNGKLVLLPIPRYYEMKLCYDSHWHPELNRQEIIKNEFGVRLSKIRHNGRYVYYIKSFFSSRLDNIFIPSGNCYSLTSWRDSVAQCFEDFDDFKEFVYYKDFLKNPPVHLPRLEMNWYYDSIRKEYFYRPRWSFYSYVCQLFDIHCDKISRDTCQIEVQRLVERAKARARAELRRKPGKLLYLRRKNYDFSQLF